MSDIEHLVNAQQKTIVHLEQQIQEIEKHLRDFEFLANLWKKAYSEEVPKLKKKISTLEGVVEQMEQELKDLKP